MAFLWDKTAPIFGAERSIALIIIMFFMALVNATSNVLFMPYMATFHPTYLTAYFVGMGLSSLIPSVFSLIQGKDYILDPVYTCKLWEFITFYCSNQKMHGIKSNKNLIPMRYHLFFIGRWFSVSMKSYKLLKFTHTNSTNVTTEYMRLTKR